MEVEAGQELKCYGTLGRPSREIPNKAWRAGSTRVSGHLVHHRGLHECIVLNSRQAARMTRLFYRWLTAIGAFDIPVTVSFQPGDREV